LFLAVRFRGQEVKGKGREAAQSSDMKCVLLVTPTEQHFCRDLWARWGQGGRGLAIICLGATTHLDPQYLALEFHILFYFFLNISYFNIVSKNDLGRLYFYRDFYVYCSRLVQHQYYCIVIVYYCVLFWCWMNIKVEVEKLKLKP